VYVSPLKALAYDVERNLRAPLAGIARIAAELGVPLAPPRVAIRTGDTSARERRAWMREPAEILVTTPESLYLMLTSQARAGFRSVDTVIVDEVHALAPTKRGAHLALSIERLAALAASDPQRVGLSATARPLEVVARYLGGDRPVNIVDRSGPPLLDLEVVVPVPDMTRPTLATESSREASGEPKRYGIWPAVVPELLQLVKAHSTTIVFVNNRSLSEKLVAQLNELAGAPLARAHHGSLSHEQRRETEELLKAGSIAAIVATSSLELGIDMGAVDLVVMVESPGSVARGLQRAGRAGHGVGEVSIARIFPKHRGDLLEAALVAQRMRDAELEPIALPKSPLDVLAQQVVAACALEPIGVAELERIVRRAASFASLPREAWLGVLDMLSGRYPSTEFAELRPRLVWDRDAGLLSPSAGARMLAIVSGGTIPDRGLYAVHLGEDGPRLGELDEEMVFETQPGHVITLGASSWRVEAITTDRVLVSPAPGELGRLPFWRGEGPGRPIELGRALGAFVRAIDERGGPWLEAELGLGRFSVDNLVRYVREQREVTGTVPSDRAITVERFRDEVGDYRISILSPFGARVHAPWALAVQSRLRQRGGQEVQAMWSDDGIGLRLGDSDTFDLPALLPLASEIEELVVDELGRSALYASRFRENAARALLLPRRRPGARTPLWQQRRRSHQLLQVARAYPRFPIVVETFRECLQDLFDMPALVEILSAIERREIGVDVVETSAPSPFARSLNLAYVAAFLYEGDAPVAERRARALALDRELLRELCGEDSSALLEPTDIAALERELQIHSDEPPHADALHHLLMRLGAQSRTALYARAGDALVDELEKSGRIVSVTIAGERLLCAVEDAAIYRDALGVTLPDGIAPALLAPVETPLAELFTRWARTRGPFHLAAFASQHGVARALVEELARTLERQGKLVRGTFPPDAAEWCDAEVLRRLKRRTIARLATEVEPVPRAVFGRFLAAWHGLDSVGKGRVRLEQAIAQLEGMPLSFVELERSMLPARVVDFSPRMLDELGATGAVVWVGHGTLGSGDGRVALYRRGRVAHLVEPPKLEAAALSPLAVSVHAALEQRGACFFADIASLAPLDELSAALYELTFAGLVTNDTFAPLRALSMRRSKSKRRGGTDLRTAGRWSLVESLVDGSVSPTACAHTRALMLLERHGIVSREAASLEALTGGFGGVYPVLRSLEEAGRVRRGYFVEGIGGVQFALPGAVDRLRALKNAAPKGAVVVAASDPANPYGWILPWPDAERPMRRASGALLVLCDGEPALHFERGGGELTLFTSVPSTLQRALSALRARLAQHGRRSLRIDRIDGIPALRSPIAPLLQSLGITFDHRGFVIERTV
jgi:ATP-dependent Lhr-like helicase